MHPILCYHCTNDLCGTSESELDYLNSSNISNNYYYGLNVCVPSPCSLPQNSYIEILAPNVLILGGGAFRRQLGHEGGVNSFWTCSEPITLFFSISLFWKKSATLHLTHLKLWKHITCLISQVYS